jgi:hypothetical protein
VIQYIYDCYEKTRITVLKFPRLELPPYSYRLSEAPDGKVMIFDPVRKKNILLTPEEWVRQHFINMLITFYKIPRGHISIESGLIYNKMQRRTDILVRNSQGTPHLLVECKAPDIQLNIQTLEQIGTYNKVLSAEHLAITNGMQTFIFKIDFETGATEQLNDLPIL